MLAPITKTGRADFDASFMAALGTFVASHPHIAAPRICKVCHNPIFSADSAAVAVTNSYGKLEWTHYACENATAPLPRPVRCPLCNKWAHQEGDRFYHIEVKDLTTGTRDDARSLFCENVNTGAEIDGSDAQDNRPTDKELNEHFLTIKGWQRVDLWIDPVSGLTHVMSEALTIQNEREDALNA